MVVQPLRQDRGFTLVELSIVIVIIGILIGVVLVSRDLVFNAQMNRTIQQYGQYVSGVNAFRLKFNCLPGDCKNSDMVYFDPASEGNGDGIVGECSERSIESCSFHLGGAVSQEYFHFWYHLSEAGFLPERRQIRTGPLPTYSIPTGVNTPESFLRPFRRNLHGDPGGWAVQSEVIFDNTAGGGSIPGHSFLLAVQVPAGGTEDETIAPGGWLPADIFRLDTKIDDGMPFSGHARGFSGFAMTSTLKYYTAVVGAGGVNSSVCVDNSSGEYRYNSQATDAINANGLCSLAIGANF